ncbi:hypothetical protein Tco_1128472 [Tanacetum coccineum]
MSNLKFTDTHNLVAFLSKPAKSTGFEQLALMGAKTTAWNEFSSTMASAIICLATNQKFNFSKYIFESMVRNLDNLSDRESRNLTSGIRATRVIRDVLAHTDSAYYIAYSVLFSPDSVILFSSAYSVIQILI